MEREKGFESRIPPVFSGTYADRDLHLESSTGPSDASGRIATERDEGDVSAGSPSLPDPSPELFIAAGITAADDAARTGAERSAVEAILRRAVDQAAALRGVVA